MSTATGTGRRGRRRGEQPMVPDAQFTSYYGRPIVKPAPWTYEIAAYLFLGGLAAGSSVLGAGADVAGMPGLRRASRFGALGALTLSFAALVHDLGRPSRLGNMLRVAKPTSPMSMGVWALTAYAPPVGIATASEASALLPGPLGRLLRRAGRPAGLTAAVIAPAVASYTAVLIADTATPAWHDAYRELPFVFVGSAASAAGGWGLLCAPREEHGPARRMAVAGAALELAATERMRSSMGLSAETLRQGTAGRLMALSRALTVAGLAGSVLGRRRRAVAAGSGAALLAGSALLRFGIFEAGQQSARDPKYTVVPQRERLAGRGA